MLARAHYLPAFSRLGPYPVAALDRMSQRAPRELFEYWGHEASLLPVASQPLFRWRMAEAAEQAWGRMRRIARERPGLVEEVLARVRQQGPLAASELESDRPRRAAGWWDWHDSKVAIEFLFWAGRVTSGGRRGFERLYDLPERVFPAAVLAAPTPDRAAAQRELVMIAAAALGVATEADLRDYFRLGPADGRARVAELVESRRLLPVTVAGWPRTAYLHPAARVPRRVSARALLAPFDPLVWFRARTERLFGVRSRIEIYVPAPKRVHGYYVLPFLLGDRLVARVDLKSDRAASRLLVQAAHLEPGGAVALVARELAAELRLLAGWLGLEDVAVAGPGELAPGLAAAL
ncbi:MAG: crosslink repair DNA glycosylase YcaQ family protein [Chloroflexota bacterium]